MADAAKLSGDVLAAESDAANLALSIKNNDNSRDTKHN